MRHALARQDKCVGISLLHPHTSCALYCQQRRPRRPISETVSGVDGAMRRGRDRVGGGGEGGQKERQATGAIGNTVTNLQCACNGHERCIPEGEGEGGKVLVVCNVPFRHAVFSLMGARGCCPLLCCSPVCSCSVAGELACGPPGASRACGAGPAAAARGRGTPADTTRGPRHSSRPRRGCRRRPARPSPRAEAKETRERKGLHTKSADWAKRHRQGFFVSVSSLLMTTAHSSYPAHTALKEKVRGWEKVEGCRGATHNLWAPMFEKASRRKINSSQYAHPPVLLPPQEICTAASPPSVVFAWFTPTPDGAPRVALPPLPPSLPAPAALSLGETLILLAGALKRVPVCIAPLSPHAAPPTPPPLALCLPTRNNQHGSACVMFVAFLCVSAIFTFRAAHEGLCTGIIRSRRLFLGCRDSRLRCCPIPKRRTPACHVVIAHGVPVKKKSLVVVPGSLRAAGSLGSL